MSLAGMKRCSKCGLVKTVGDFSRDASRLDGLAGSCRGCKSELNEVHSRTLEGRFSRSKAGAKERKISWDISFSKYASLVTNAHCYYCGGDLPEAGSGLDRLDGSLGYRVGNVVPSCNGCNSERNHKMARLGIAGNVAEVFGTMLRRIEELFDIAYSKEQETTA